jgi:hypothetical protein
MAPATSPRVLPFAWAVAAIGIVALAVARLPESFVSNMERNRDFSSGQAGWFYRLILLAAVAQVVYGGYFILRSERVRRAQERDPRIAAMPHRRLITSLARTAAAMVMLTLAYGLASLFITGERGGFWVFPLLAVGQAAWYFRQVGDIERWLGFQPEPVLERPRAEWTREPPDYIPPLVRGLTLEPPEGPAPG